MKPHALDGAHVRKPNRPFLLDPRRRTLLKGTAASSALAITGSLTALYARTARAASTQPIMSPYGTLTAVNDLATGLPLLQLPPGFAYKSFGWAGDVMSNGRPCPAGHDGMGVVRTVPTGAGFEYTLVRNHELVAGDVIEAPARYDSARIYYEGRFRRLAGGTTNLIFRDGNWAGMTPSLGGTVANCAGGVTPWGTWLSCEEVALDAVNIFGKRHGFVFEVAADAAQTSGAPIVGMGRFAHEAVAVDPASGIVYMTEDDRNVSALYRYVPNNLGGGLGALAQGGTLQAARVVGRPNMNLLAPQLGEIYALEWVTIGDPDKGRRFVSVPNSTGTASGPFAQAWEQGALRMSRGEGITFAAGQMFIVDTSAGVDAQGQLGYGDGAIWALDLANQTLRTVFVSASASAANNPDNITVRPGGGLFFCEDGGGVQDVDGFGNRIMGLTAQGETFIFARNNVVVDAAQLAAAGKVMAAGDYRSKEFCGACFDPTGQILFVNIQTPGITFAITGPWNAGTALRSDPTGGFLLR